ncbi:unnamed protein product [Dovyalis caffra]|uniref:F-box domain-containing protein n=1 Tax=Dovyalis caffra TaxID=77055 RepID=A0AAV1RU67_9ROSI|nr:unnamed protein product [Dovyalis caffra]
MKRSKSTPESENQDLTLRRSERLEDRFMKLPEEVMTKIFSTMEDDPKTLIRCYAVSKNWASFVSKTVKLSLIFYKRGARRRSLVCSKLHYHIPPTALRAIMKLFTDLESLQIKICHPTSQAPASQQIMKIKVGWSGDYCQTDACMAFEVGLLSTMKGVKLCRDYEKQKLATISRSSIMYFYWNLLDLRPDTLRSMVLMTSKVEESRSGGKVFLRCEEERSKMFNSLSNLRANESILEDPQNVVYWHKNGTDKENLLREQVWLVDATQYSLTMNGLERNDPIVKEAHIKELLDGLDDAHVYGNGKGKRRKYYLAYMSMKIEIKPDDETIVMTRDVKELLGGFDDISVEEEVYEEIEELGSVERRG